MANNDNKRDYSDKEIKNYITSHGFYHLAGHLRQAMVEIDKAREMREFREYDDLRHYHWRLELTQALLVTVSALAIKFAEAYDPDNQSEG